MRLPFRNGRTSSRTSSGANSRARGEKQAAVLVLARLNGADACLRKPLASGGLRKSKRVPRFWRALTPSLAGSQAVSERRSNTWLLVLAAKKIPHLFFPGGASPRLYVPPLWEGVALHEIRAVEAERPVPIFVPPARDNIGGVLTFLALLLVWHGLRWRWFTFSLPVPPFPALAQDWPALFGLDVYRVRVLHEWWRAVTALTLHSDDVHLFSNLGFGLFFFIPLCRRAGLGLGVALAVLAGALGNVGNALTHEVNVLSIGFSTALFGAVGALCALTGADIYRHQRRFAHMRAPASGLAFTFARRLFVPLAAGMALLAILGGGGEVRTDYAAHIWGFCCGLAVTLATLPVEEAVFSLPPIRQRTAQAALFAGTLLFVAAFWAYAL